MMGARSGRRLLVLLAATGCSRWRPAPAQTIRLRPRTRTPRPRRRARRRQPPRQSGRRRAGGLGGGLDQLDETQLEALGACLEGRGVEVPDGATNLQALFGGGPPSAEL